MKKRLLSLLLVLALFLSLLPAAALAEEGASDRGIIASGDCGAEGDNVTWTLYDDGRLVISGTGEMAGDDPSTPRWDIREITTVEISSGVTGIGDYSFGVCSNLTSVTLPSTLTSIGELAFTYCTSLTNITLPAGLTSIGRAAFCNCSSLPSITIPEGVTSISPETFWKCYSLKSVTIPSTVTSIGYGAFDSCRQLSSVTIPEGVTSIGLDTFRDCSSLKSVTFPSTVTSIGQQAFRNCSSLTSAALPKGLTEIGICSFYKCSALTSVTIPSTVTSIDKGAFGDCGALSDVYYCGTEADRAQAEAGWEHDGNDSLFNAVWHYCSKPTITAQPQNATAAAGSTAAFTVKATEAAAYQWQYRKSVSGSWANSPAAGNKTDTLKVAVTAAKNGYQYRCKVTNAAGSVTSAAATLTVSGVKPTITQQPQDVSAAAGSTATFSVKATGATAYQWQFRKTADGAWANATAGGNKTATLKVPVTAYKNGYQYRCKVTNAAGSVFSSVATLSILSKPVITAQPQDVTAAPGTTAAFSVTASNAASYQWQYRKSSTDSWLNSPASGNTTATLNVPVESRKNGYQYRCKVTNAAGSVISSVATLTVAVPTVPAITQQPQDVTTAAGTTAVFTVAATGAETYQWQYRKSASGSWTNSPASGNTTATLRVSVSASKNGYQYRCIVSNAVGSVESAVATLTVAVPTAPAITQQPQDVSAAPGTTAVFTVAATGAETYQWQYRKSASGSWANSPASGNATATLRVSVSAGKNGYQYRCIVSNAVGSVESAVATLTVTG